MTNNINSITSVAFPPLPRGPLFTNREGRSKFVVDHFSTLWKGSVLDVGCFQRDLGAALPMGLTYVGVDLMGKPDIKMNLDTSRLPFDDNSFNVVVCVDVLEHLENIHAVLDELLRVGSHHILVTLPNCWHGNWRWILPGIRKTSGKYYGLPPQRPPDRHRWFFNTFEAVEFLNVRTRQTGATIDFLDYSLPQTNWRQALLRILLGKNYWAWAPATIWAILRKQ